MFNNVLKLISPDGSGYLKISNLSRNEKAEYGYVQIQGGNLQNLRNDPGGKISQHISKINQRLPEGEEVSEVLLNPPGRMESSSGQNSDEDLTPATNV